MRHEYLDNGIELVLKENHFSPTVAIQCWVRVGSIHEGPDERGMAHFIEHMLFKGTQRRAVGEIAAVVEGCGGEINAYTTFDHTVFHITMASPQADVAIDLLADAIAHSAFDEAEFEREREVILEEIRRGLDSPGGLVGRKIFEMRYSGSEAGRPIIGSPESVGGFKRDDLYRFYKKWYQPQNMSVVMVGDFDTEHALAKVKQYFGALPKSKTTAQLDDIEASVSFGMPPLKTDKLRAAILKGDYKQPRLELVWPVPSFEHPDAAALDLAAFALGSGEMARLSRRLRDDEGVVNNVGASTYLPKFGGIFEVSCFMPIEQIKTAASRLAREVALLRTREPVTADELQRARANLKIDRIARDETVDGQARSLGSSLRTTHKLLHDDVYTAQVNGMLDVALQHAVDRWLKPEQAFLVALVPEGCSLTEAELLAAYQSGVSEADALTKKLALEPLTKADRTRAQAQRQGVKDEIFELLPGVKLVHRENPAAQLFTLTAATEGGLRAETTAEAGIQHAMAGLLCMESEQHSYEELISTIEGMGASLEGFSGKDSMGLHLQCLVEHTDAMLQLMRGCLLQPIFPQVQWQNLKREIEQAIAAQNDSPGGMAVRRFQEQLYGDHPYRHPLHGTADSVQGFDEVFLCRRFKEFRDAGPWVFATTSPQTGALVAEHLKAILQGFAPRSTPRSFASEQLQGQSRPTSVHLFKEREQSHVVFGFPGLSWGDQDRPALDVLVNILGGNAGRLFIELRDKNSLAYSVSPLISYGQHPGVIGSYIACAPAKEATALAALKYEMHRLVEEPPSEAELTRAKAYIVGTHDMGLQRSDAQTSTMALMEIYGHGYDDFLRYPRSVERVTREQVQRVAKRLIVSARAIDVTVGPNPRS